MLNDNLEMFGVRPECWLEAKFFRKNQKEKPTLDKTLAVYALMRDLLRLSVFPNEPLKSARFLLHAYEGKPKDHLSMSLNTGKKETDKKGKRLDRTWLCNILKSGSHKLDFKDISKEPATFDNEIGSAVRTIKATMDVTNFCIDTEKSLYSLYLTRIDGFSIEWDDNKTQINTNEISDPSGLDGIQTLLNDHLKK